MAVNPVPWMLGGGALHGPAVGRNMLHIATMRTQGIVGTSDLRVSQMTVPGAGVRIAFGSALLWMNGSPDVQQTYSFLNDGPITNFPIASTGSSGGRSDLVIARVEDPYDGSGEWQNPPSAENGPYAFIRVIPGVPAGTTSLKQLPGGRFYDTAIVLARIDIPANTATITDAMITDLRKMAAPRSVTYTNTNQGTSNETLNYETFANWPTYAPGWEVPEWATHAQVRAFLSGIYAQGVVDGEMRVQLNVGGQEQNPLVAGPIQKYDLNSTTDDWQAGGGAQRFTMILAAYGAVHPARGQILYQQIRSHKLPNRPDRRTIQVDANSTIMFDITFYERPI